MATTDVYAKIKPAVGEAPVAGKDMILMIFNEDGTETLAISGQRGLTLNRSAESLDVTSKDDLSGWGKKIAGMKEWGVETDGVYYASDASLKKLSDAFLNSDVLPVFIYNRKTEKPLYGGTVSITDFPLEAPYDDAMTYSLSMEGAGPLVDISDLELDPVTP